MTRMASDGEKDIKKLPARKKFRPLHLVNSAKGVTFVKI